MANHVAYVSSDEAALVLDGVVVRQEGLEPSTTYELHGLSFATLPRPGERLATVVTVNDVHFGETTCGLIEGDDVGPVFSAPEGAEPYPSMMNRHVVAEIATLHPEAVVVKGDLTSNGTMQEYQSFLDCYQSAFGDRLHHVRGNHESYHALAVANQAFQEIHVEGAVIALLDTSRDHQVNGELSLAQLDALDELGARTSCPVLVLGHHPIWDAQLHERRDDNFNLKPGSTEALLEVFARRPRLVTYAAGHTHRNAVTTVGGVDCVEVASVKEFPGAFAEYQVFDGGVLQVVRRASHPEAVAWCDLTSQMYSGFFGSYAYGSLADRCRELPLRRG